MLALATHWQPEAARLALPLAPRLTPISHPHCRESPVALVLASGGRSRCRLGTEILGGWLLLRVDSPGIAVGPSRLNAMCPAAHAGTTSSAGPVPRVSLHGRTYKLHSFAVCDSKFGLLDSKFGPKEL
jgi:hypothetical protein